MFVNAKLILNSFLAIQNMHSLLLILRQTFFMHIISYNVNGIRSAIKKGFLGWLKTNPADVICIQETKAAKGDVDHTLFNELGYFDYWYSAQKKGYSGVAVFTKIEPANVKYGTGHKVSD